MIKIDVPPNKPNTRFFEDAFARSRPALTFAGFDNGGDHQFGYGLKQVIERGLNVDSVEHQIIQFLLDRATLDPSVKDSQEANAKTFAVNRNSQVFSARCFIALLTLILEENKQSLPGIELISHQSSMEMLRASLLTDTRAHPLYANEILSGPDRVKWTTSLANMARGLDLYLALENAYAHYNKDDSSLLTAEEKAESLARHITAISETLDFVDSNVGIGALISGNWSLKMWAAAAYACLGAQYRNEAELRQLFVWFGRGLRRSGPGDTSEKRRYWTYMSSKEVGGEIKAGQRTWAEGPYYLHFTLQDVIPLWHAVRSQGYLNAPEHDVNFTDPFHSSWFMAPIDWLADVTTPDGETPPFDDGNRRPMFNANLMTWSPQYGDGPIGEKMNWVFQKITEARKGPICWKKCNTDAMLVQLAIPKTEKVLPPASVAGNRSIVARDEEQLIIRRTINGKNHFICLHGETDIASIIRGEGHEQPDQLQLLYYLDHKSLIMDAGYDRGFVSKNSTWNRYTDHNVMSYTEGDSGMESPSRLTKRVSHEPVDFLYIDESSNEHIYILTGQTRLKWRKGKQLSLRGYKHEANGQYKRTVLFIADEHLPYLIDINQVKNDVLRGDTPSLNMRYHVESNDYHHEENHWHTWLAGDDPNVYLYFDCVEHNDAGELIQMEEVEVEERFRSKEKITRFTCEGKAKDTFTTVGIFRADHTTPASLPASLPPVESAISTSEAYSIWRWDNKESDSVDVLFVRALSKEAAKVHAIQFDINLDNQIISFVCNSAQEVGFARCKETAGKWHVEAHYLYGLEVLPEHLPA
ncbi:MAG: hypothetical protein AB8G77_08875 [Rhodothermales bacterium]